MCTRQPKRTPLLLFVTMLLSLAHVWSNLWPVPELLLLHSAYRTVSAVNGPLVVLDNVKVYTAIIDSSLLSNMSVVPKVLRNCQSSPRRRHCPCWPGSKTMTSNDLSYVASISRCSKFRASELSSRCSKEPQVDSPLSSSMFWLIPTRNRCQEHCLRVQWRYSSHSRVRRHAWSHFRRFRKSHW